MAENKREWKKNWVLAERLMEIGITLPVASVLGWLVGAFFDKKLHSSWAGIVGLVVGGAAGLVRVVQIALLIGGKEMDRDDAARK